MLATWHWHIEISSKCTLRCPACSREEVPRTLVNAELNLEFFKCNFTPEFILQNVQKITFCGNNGDPIYAKDLIPVVKYFKSIKPDVELVIITNGSYKETKWWAELGQSLNDHDEVHFSVDGFNQESNALYRVNSSWMSIIAGITALRYHSKAFITWASVAFAFNEDHLEQMKEQARKLGCDKFQLTKSTKWGPGQKPTVVLTSSTGRYERDITNLSGRTKSEPWNSINIELFNKSKGEKITPLCSIGNKGTYISAHGRLYPCCWVATRYTHNNEWDQISIDLNQTTLIDALQDKTMLNELKTYRWLDCRTKCNSTVANLSYCTAW